MRSKYRFVALILLFIVSLSNNQLNLTESNPDRTYWPTEEWQYASFEQVGLNEERIVEMFEDIEDNNYAIDSVLIVKDGFLVVEEYLTAYTSETLHPVYSVTKSFISTLIGKAIAEGYIESVDQKILDFLGHVDVPNIVLKENVTIAHLLTMTSGLEWIEDISYYDPANSFRQLIESTNWVEYILSQNMADEPGNAWNYNSGGSHLLSAIIENATGVSTLEYADTHIFSALGFSDYFWDTDPQDICFGGSDLHLLPRDMAKFGYLLLNNGTWGDTQIVSEEWVSQATEGKITLTDRTHYGYQWWVYPLIDSYLALGWAGQIICVIPEHDIVAIFSSSLDESDFPFREYFDYIIKASEEGYTEYASLTLISIIFSISICTIVIVFRRKKRS